MSRQKAVSKSQQKRQMTYQENTIRFDQAKPARQRPVDIVPRTRNQERLVLALQDPDQAIVVTAGPAGTGKTYLAMLAAVKAFRAGEVDRIVLTRPAVSVEDERHGFLPGDLNQKMDPWVRPLTDILREYYRQPDIAAMISEQTIEIAPLAFMRGRTFRNAFIIADEFQNSSKAHEPRRGCNEDAARQDARRTQGATGRALSRCRRVQCPPANCLIILYF